MIDPETEDLIPLAEAAAILPKSFAEKRIHPTTLRRWTREGVDGVILEAVKVGRRLFTSKEAVMRFIQQQETAGTTRWRRSAKGTRSQARKERTKAILKRAGLEP
jgi:hypothetical protein